MDAHRRRLVDFLPMTQRRAWFINKPFELGCIGIGEPGRVGDDGEEWAVLEYGRLT